MVFSMMCMINLMLNNCVFFGMYNLVYIVIVGVVCNGWKLML